MYVLCATFASVSIDSNEVTLSVTCGLRVLQWFHQKLRNLTTFKASIHASANQDAGRQLSWSLANEIIWGMGL